MCCIEENKKRDFERLYEQEQWKKLKMLLTENAEEVSCLLTPGELRQMMEKSGRHGTVLCRQEKKSMIG